MVWAATAITFFAVVGISVALLYAFMPGGVNVAGRVSRFLDPSVEQAEKAGFAEKQKVRVGATLASFGKHLPANSGKKESSAQLLMLRAGYRRPNAVLAMRGVKVLLPWDLQRWFLRPGLTIVVRFCSC